MSDARTQLAQSLYASELRMDAGLSMINNRPALVEDFTAKWGDEAGDAYASLLEARAAMDRLVELVRKGDLRPHRETTNE